MSFAAVNGIQMYYESTGSGFPVVFCHGAGGNHESWFQQVPEFSKRYRCITIDHRGFGQSKNASGQPNGEAFVPDLEALLAHLGIDQVAIVCQSMGGITGLGFTLAHPERVRALVLADTTGGVTDDEIRQLRESLVPPVQDRTDLLSRALGEPFQKQFPEKAKLYHEISGKNPPEGYQPGRNATNPPDLAKVAALKVPTLLLVGEVDKLAPPPVMELMLKRIPGSTLVKVPGAGHSVYFEKPEEFNNAVLGFLDEVVK